METARYWVERYPNWQHPGNMEDEAIVAAIARGHAGIKTTLAKASTTYSLPKKPLGNQNWFSGLGTLMQAVGT